MNKVTKLQLRRRMPTFALPPIVLAVIIAFFVIIWAVIERASGGAASGADARNNVSLVTGMVPFLFSLGVTSITSCYPLSRALGAGRRGYVWGTGLYFVLVSIYMTLLTLLALGIEKLTGGWYFGIPILSADVLGGGSALRLIPIVLIGSFFSLCVGALFGVVWMRFGNTGTWLLVAGFVLVIALLLWAAVPQLPWVLQHLNTWNVLAVLLVLALLVSAVNARLIRTVNIRQA